MWSQRILSPEQIEYAAKDALVSLALYTKLKDRPDPTKRLDIGDDRLGAVDIYPSGSTSVMAHKVAEGEIVESTQDWQNPYALEHFVKVTSTRRLVRVTRVMAPAYKLPKFIGDPARLTTQPLGDRDRYTLEDLKRKSRDGEFFVVLPVSCLHLSDGARGESGLPAYHGEPAQSDEYSEEEEEEQGVGNE
jgi:hypothetical protein